MDRSIIDFEKKVSDNEILLLLLREPSRGVARASFDHRLSSVQLSTGRDSAHTLAMGIHCTDSEVMLLNKNYFSPPWSVV